MKEIVFLLFILATTNAMTQTKEKKFLALGDSYTIGESVAENERWPVQLVAALNKNGKRFAAPKIIATTGWRTDDLKAAIKKENPPRDWDLVSLLIGVNNQYQGRSVADYAPEFEELLNMAIEFAGGDKSKVFVVSIPDYGFTPFGKEKQDKISKELDEFNNINKKISEKYGVEYFYITEISRRGLDEPALVATDGLHPSDKMYAEWVRLICQGLNIK
jgi:lysophospholipase L1-like esterase